MEEDKGVITKDANKLNEFLESLERVKPVVPEALVAYYLQKAGFQTQDPKVLRLVGLATQKFLSEVCYDTMKVFEIRQSSSKKDAETNKDLKMVFTTEDLACSLKEYGIDIKKPEYFADNLQIKASAPTTK